MSIKTRLARIARLEARGGSGRPDDVPHEVQTAVAHLIDRLTIEELDEFEAVLKLLHDHPPLDPVQQRELDEYFDQLAEIDATREPWQRWPAVQNPKKNLLPKTH